MFEGHHQCLAGSVDDGGGVPPQKRRLSVADSRRRSSLRLPQLISSTIQEALTNRQMCRDLVGEAGTEEYTAAALSRSPGRVMFMLIYPTTDGPSG